MEVSHVTADYNGSGGIGFLVSPIAFKSLDKVQYKSERVMRLQVSGHPKGAPKTLLVCAYAPLMSLTQLLETYFTHSCTRQ